VGAVKRKKRRPSALKMIQESGGPFSDSLKKILPGRDRRSCRSKARREKEEKKFGKAGAEGEGRGAPET